MVTIGRNASVTVSYNAWFGDSLTRSYKRTPSRYVAVLRKGPKNTMPIRIRKSPYSSSLLEDKAKIRPISVGPRLIISCVYKPWYPAMR